MFGTRAHLWQITQGAEEQWRWAVYRGSRQVFNSGESFPSRNYARLSAIKAMNSTPEKVQVKSCWIPAHRECQVLVP